jgi:hypothetical protein
MRKLEDFRKNLGENIVLAVIALSMIFLIGMILVQKLILT